MADPVIKEKTKSIVDIKEPCLFNVVYINDEVTTMEFVIESLMSVFNHSEEMAQTLCDVVHEKGSAIVALLPYEIGEQKGIEVTTMARNQGYPLLVRLEPNI